MAPNANHSTYRVRSNKEIALQLRPTEKLILALFLLLLITILVVSGWSAALVLLGYEGGGGPIGAVADLLS
ncbi:MAG: hypothetical protein P8X39_12260 [Desulfofustis sp.]